jgi:hypothetical protein
MELYGSLLNISGSVTASTFTGSFIGDGSGLTGIQATGVVGLNLSQIATGSFTASLSLNGFNVNTDTSITGAVNITGSISLNGEPIGTGKLNETTFQTYTSSNDGRVVALETSSGSLNSFTSSINTTIKSKLDSDGVISGSSQILNGSNIVSSSSQILNGSNIVSSSTQVTAYGFATTGSNLFIGTQTHSGSILPSVDNAYDLGSTEYQWRDVFISSGSLYIDGTKVLSSTAQELTITTDTGQSIKILEGTTDSIVLQVADGDIELKSSADGDILLDPTYGKIMLKGPVEILTGQKIQSSVGGTPVVFANDIVVSGSIDLTGTIDGIDLTAFSSSVNTRIGNLETSTGSLNEFTSSTNSRLTSIETSTGSLNIYTGSNNTIIGTLQTATSSLNTYTSSNTTNINAIHTATSSLNTFTSSINTTIKSKLDNDGVISGSSQVLLTGTTGYSTFSSSVATSVNDLSSSINSLSSTDTSLNNRLDTIEGRYATTGSNVFIGDQTITGSLYISQNLIVQGSSSLENITASAVSIGTNTIILNADTPAIRYAGISVFDSGSTNVTASLFYDSLTNNWKFKHSDVGTDDASILLFGPLGTGIDNAPTLVANFLTKVEDDGHGHHLTTSSVFDNGSKISLKNNTEITGSLIVTSTIVSQGTTLVSGSGQISYAGITNVPSGIVSGSGQVSFGGITDKPALVSGSSQISFGGITDKPALVSGSSQISFNGITDKPTLVSGSSQILAGTTIHSGSFFNGITVVSGSSQISFNGITDKPTLVSGSSQIVFGSITGVPGGLVSGSSQIDLTATTNYSSGIKTRLNTEGVISGSAQISSAGFITGYTETDTLATVTGRGASTSTDLTFNGALTMGTTGTQYIRMGRFPSSITNSGEAWIGRASDRSVGTMTIQLGTGADRNFEVVDHAWSTVVFNAGMNSITYKNNVVWHAGNDGAASGLDADLLDGSHASAFSPVAGSSSITTVGTIATGVWNGTAIAVANGGTGASTAANAITNLGATTVGGNLFTLTNPSAIRFIRINANNTISTLSDSDFRTAIGAGTSSTTGTVTSVGGTGTVSGLSLSGTVTSTGNLTLGGTLTVAASNFSSQTANTFLAAPNGSSGTPTFRTIVAADIPTLNQNTTGNAATSTSTSNIGGATWAPTSNILLGQSANNQEWSFDITRNGFTGGYWHVWDSANSTMLKVDAVSGKVSAPYNFVGTLEGNITGTASNITAYTINQNLGTSNSVKFGSHCDLNISNSAFRFYDGSTFRGGLGTDDWAHSGSAANVTLFATAVLHFTSGGTKRAYFDTNGHLLPQVNNTYNLGSASLGWANVYTNDLHLSNMNKPEGNDIDGTNGTWTIQEGAENLYIINNNNGKKYKISLEEIV